MDAQAAICIHMEFIFILQSWVFWIVGMSNKAKCDTFLEINYILKINWKYDVTRFSDDQTMCFLF